MSHVQTAPAGKEREARPDPEGRHGSAGAPEGDGYRAGVALLNRQKLAEAEPLLRRAVATAPGSARAHAKLGLALLRQKKLAEALPPLERARELRPDWFEPAGNLGVALLELGRPADAVPHLLEALGSRPDLADLHNALGTAYAGLRRYAEAEGSFREALRLQPDSARAHSNYAALLRQLDRPDEALEHGRRAVALDPDLAEAHLNLGLAHMERAEPGAALACYEHALRLRPEDAETRTCRAVAWLALGRFEPGWPEYEWRWQCPDMRPRAFAQPRWDGSPLRGRTVLLHAEQGAGDCLQFVRYAALAKRRGGTVLLECWGPLARLLAACPGVDRVCAQHSELPPFDVQVPLLSLPGLFGTTLPTVPADMPYLFADAEATAAWRAALARLEGLKVGIAWQGNPRHPRDATRSVPLSHFAPLAAVPGVRLVSLQKGPGAEQLAALAGRFPVEDVAGQAGDFADTAALVQGLDLVITIDSAVAHLAGGLGVPAWVALPYAAEWRWLLGRADSPWYPTMRLFRQDRPGDWAGVFGRLADALGRWAGGAPDRPAAGPAPLEPALVEAHRRGLDLLREGRWAEAEQALGEAARGRPDWAEARLDYGTALARQRQFDAAAAAFDAALGLRPDWPEALMNRGLVS